MEPSYCPYCMHAVDDGGRCPACGLTAGTYMPLPHHLPPGARLRGGRYLVGRALGSGGFGITYIGRDLTLGTRVAIKEYFPSGRATRSAQRATEVVPIAGMPGDSLAEGRERFLGEAQRIASMEKLDAVVGIRDTFGENGTAYIVMEYVEGATLAQLAAQRGGRVPPDELLGLVRPLLPTLAELHARGLCHRDISPDNLMLERGRVRLVDFGCAREAGPGDGPAEVKEGYAPIEQYTGEACGARTDVYALCATLYACLTGTTPPGALERAVADELVPPRELGVSIGARQEKALLRGMAVPPRRRFRSMEQLEAALYDVGPEAPADKGQSNPDDKQSAEPTPIESEHIPQDVEPSATSREHVTRDTKSRPKAWLVAVISCAACMLIGAALWHWNPGERTVEASSQTPVEANEQAPVEANDQEPIEDIERAPVGQASKSGFYIASSQIMPYSKTGAYATSSKDAAPLCEAEGAFSLVSFLDNGSANGALIESSRVEILELEPIESSDLALLGGIKGDTLYIYAINNGWAEADEQLDFRVVAPDSPEEDPSPVMDIEAICESCQITSTVHVDPCQIVNVARLTFDRKAFSSHAVRNPTSSGYVWLGIHGECEDSQGSKTWNVGYSKDGGFQLMRAISGVGSSRAPEYSVTLATTLDVDDEPNEIVFTGAKSCPMVDGEFRVEMIVAPTKSCRLTVSASFLLDGVTYKTMSHEAEVTVPAYLSGFDSEWSDLIPDLLEEPDAPTERLTQIGEDFRYDPGSLVEDAMS